MGKAYIVFLLLQAVSVGCGGGGKSGDPDTGLLKDLPEELEVGGVPDGVQADVTELSGCEAGCTDLADLGLGELADLAAGEDLLPDTVEDLAVELEDLADEQVDQDVKPDVKPPPQFHHPAMWGPYQVGVRSYQLYDSVRQRSVPTYVWYPATPDGQALEKYVFLLEGKAYQDAPADNSGAPYPMVLFSHGFNGISWQSLSFTNFVASHGYVVVAMDHQGNTLFDFNADDELAAKVAIERPHDVKFAYQEVAAMSMKPTNPLSGMVEPSRIAMTGHSFGGYTALMVAGGFNVVDDAKAACEAGAPSDIFCPYIGYWPAGETVSLTPGIPGLKAVACLAPGGYSAFGDSGLAAVDVPALIVGGSLDPTTPMDVEIHPIFGALPPPKIEAEVINASHMSFTNVCDLPPAQYFLDEFCGVEGMLGPDETFPPVNALVVSFLNVYVKKEAMYAGFLAQSYLDEAFGYVQLSDEL